MPNPRKMKHRVGPRSLLAAGIFASLVFVSGCTNANHHDLQYLNTARYQVTTPPYHLIAHAVPGETPLWGVPTMPPRDRRGGGWLYDRDRSLWVYYSKDTFNDAWQRMHPAPQTPLAQTCPTHYRFLGFFSHIDPNDRRIDSLVCIPAATKIKWPAKPIYFVNRDEIVTYISLARKQRLHAENP